MALFQTAVLNKYLKELDGERAQLYCSAFTADLTKDHALQAEIDALVYQMYGLAEEVRVVKGNN